MGENGENGIEVVAGDHGESMMDKEEDFSSESESDIEIEDEEEVGKDSKPDAKKKEWFSSMFQSIAGKANLDKLDLEPALKALKDRLMTKNVAEDIAEKLCELVVASLEGKKLASFTRISSTVQVFRSIDFGFVKGFPKGIVEAEAQNLMGGKNLKVDKSIHTAYVKAIRSAQHFKYIENQYFVGSSFFWPSYKNAGADNLVPMELALKILEKIKANEHSLCIY